MFIDKFLRNFRNIQPNIWVQIKILFVNIL